MRILFIIALSFLIACNAEVPSTNNDIIVQGTSKSDAGYLTIGSDTLWVKDGSFLDTLQRPEDQYNYIKFDTWKWPRIVYLQTNDILEMDATRDTVSTNSHLNNFLLNKDSILMSYSSRWDMSEAEFKTAWKEEFGTNLLRIDHYFKEKSTPKALVEEVKQMEYMLRGHLTANFISFQERKGNSIDRSIYEFVKEIDLNNDRLGFHVNNKNFQYYYYLDKVEDTLPEANYPFAIIDTAHKYVHVKSIKDMIIKGAVRSGLNSDSVDHDALFKVYEKHIGEITKDDKILKTYNQLLKLKPGNPAPSFGTLMNAKGEEITIESLKGKNILLSVWGTWCPYCKEELPQLKKLTAKYENKVESIAISLDKDEEKWRTYINQNNWSANHLIDAKRKSEFKTNYLISGTNIYYLIDKKGIIVAKGIKPSSGKMEELIGNLQ